MKVHLQWRYFRKPWHKISTVVCIVLAILVVTIGVHDALLGLRLAFAQEQVAVFREMVDKAAVAQDAAEAERYLDYVHNYYPSGTKQVPGSRLHGMVEDARAMAIGRIEGEIRRRDATVRDETVP